MDMNSLSHSKWECKYHMVEIFAYNSRISAIIKLTSYKNSCFRAEKTGHWSFVCKTKFHRPHSKNVKGLLPVRQQIYVSQLTVVANQLRCQIDLVRDNAPELKCF